MALRNFFINCQSQGANSAFETLTGLPYKSKIKGVPSICLRVPTGGGKTLIASHSIGVAGDAYLNTDAPVVLWLVPSDMIRQQTLKALSDVKSNIKDIDLMLRNLEEKGAHFKQANQNFNTAIQSYSATQLEYENVLKGLNKELTYTNLVTKPSPDNKKAYPIRWLIVLASVVSTNLFLLYIGSLVTTPSIITLA